MAIKYEDPKDNPNRVNLLTNYIDYLLNIDLKDIESKSCYEAYFYIGKLCSLGPTQDEFKILEKKNVFIQALKALYEKVETIDFKESVFVYILYSINILNFFIPSNDKDIGSFAKLFLKDQNGLESIVSFLNNETFITKNLNLSVNVFGNETRIIKLLIANLTGLSKRNDKLFKDRCQELKFSVIDGIFHITNNIDYLESNNNLIETKSVYEDLFYIAKLCSLEPTSNVFDISLENNSIFHMFIQALKFLYEKVETIDFTKNKTIEKYEPKLEKDFKESIFVYILYSINILNKNVKDFGKIFLVKNGLESIVSFLNNETFIDKYLNSNVNLFGNETRIIKLLIANLNGLIENNDELFKDRCQKLNPLLIETIFKIINKAETKSDITYSAYLFLSKICSEDEIKERFSNILIKYDDDLKKCADDFNPNQNPKDIEHKCREIRFVLDLYIQLKVSYENKQVKLSEEAISAIENVIFVIRELDKKIKNDLEDNDEVLEGKLRLFGKIDDSDYEPKTTQNHDAFSSKIVHPNTILISFDLDNEPKCNELSERLMKTYKFDVWTDIINNNKDTLDTVDKVIEKNACILMSVAKNNENKLPCSKYIKKKAKRIICLKESDFEESGLQTLKGKIEESMNEEQVSAWFERNKLDSAINELATNGQVLKQLWETKLNNPEFFIQQLKTKLENNPNCDDLIKEFSQALDKLFSS